MTKIALYRTKGPIKSNPKRWVWQLRWVGTDGIRYCETLDDVAKLPKREAEAMRRAKQSKMDCGVIRSNKPERITLTEFLRRDRQAVTAVLKATTIGELETAANHATAALGADFPMRRFDERSVDRIRAHLAGKNLSAATLCKVIRYLQGAFRRAVKRKLIPSNPFDGVELPKVQPKRVRIFQPAEAAALIESAPDVWWEALIRVGYTTGLRLGEILNLTWANVDLGKRRVHVDAERAGEFTVGDQAYPILEWSSKTYQSRVVPMPPDTVGVLRRMQARSGGSVYVFLSLERLAQIGQYRKREDRNASYKLVNNLGRAWDAIQDDAAARLSEGRDEPYTWERRSIKTLRKSYGTVMAQHLPAHELKALMGHSSIITTQRYYLAPSDDLSAKVADAFTESLAVAV